MTRKETREKRMKTKLKIGLRVYKTRTKKYGKIVSFKGLPPVDRYFNSSGYVSVKFDDGEAKDVYVSKLWPAEDTQFSCSENTIDGLTKKGQELRNKYDKDFRKMNAEFNKKMDVIVERLSFLRETGGVEFSVTEYKVWKALEAFESKNLSRMEKAKEIARIMKRYK